MARWYLQRPGTAPVGPIDAAELRAAWSRREIAPDSLVCAEGFSQWAPFHTVAELVWAPAPASNAHMPFFPPREPTRAGVALAGLLIVPVVWFVIHLALLGTPGIFGPTLVMGFTWLAAIVVASTSLRLKSAAQLLKTLPFAIPVAVLFVVGEGWGLGYGISARIRHDRMVTGLANSDPCVARDSVSYDDLQELGNEGDKALVAQKSQDCETKKRSARCAKLTADIERGGPPPTDKADAATTAVTDRLDAGAIGPVDLALSNDDAMCGDALWNAVGASADAQSAFLSYVESAAKAALTKEMTKDMADAMRFCGFRTTALRVAPSVACVALGKRYAQEKATEDTYAAMENSAAEVELAAKQKAQWKKKNDCQMMVSTVKVVCKSNCKDQFSLLDPGPGQDALVSKCETECDKQAPHFSDCN